MCSEIRISLPAAATGRRSPIATQRILASDADAITGNAPGPSKNSLHTHPGRLVYCHR